MMGPVGEKGTGVELLTIGAFARAARLSPKALRLYDELGLLPPAAVDAESGYRFYDPAQLERARLIAALRRLDMPLARIAQVCVLPPAQAAAQISRYWAQVAADTAVREQLATHLVGRLSGGAPDTGARDLVLRHATRCEPGLVRDTNEDVAYAGSRLLAVADGLRGAAGGLASAEALEALRPLDLAPAGGHRLLGHHDPAAPTGRRDAAGPLGHDGAAGSLDALAAAFGHADTAVGALGAGAGAVTTLTVLLWTGGHVALAHVGDTRAYLLREGGLRLLTRDHSWVRGQLDLGRLSHEEAAAHPRRSLLTGALDGAGARPDLSLHPVATGDRLMLCTDGLWSVVATATLRTTLARADADPQQTADELVAAAYAAGAPDNVACVVAEVTAA